MEKKKRMWLCYTGVFCILCVVCFGYFYIHHRTFVWEKDGCTQHYKALVYYSRWMKEFIREILCQRTLSVSTFSFSFGLGADALTTLQYYVIGDPFNLFAVLVPERYLMYYYAFMILLRLYCAGLAFLAFACYMGKEKRAALTGAVVYVFSSWAFYAAVRHPYFANPMIYFPLLLLGVEKIRKQKRPGLMVVVTALAAVSNFYFFYMLGILVACYTLLAVLLPWEKGTWKRKIQTILQVAGYAAEGLLISAVSFLPVVLRLLADSRQEGGYAIPVLYQSNFYKRFLIEWIAEGEVGSWTVISVSSVALLAVFLLFLRKGAKWLRLKAAFMISIAALLLPFAGHFLHGFSYACNRWSWGVVFLMAYTVAELWPELFVLTRKEGICLGISLGIYFVLCARYLCSISSKSYSQKYYFAFCVAVMALIVLWCGRTDTGEAGLKRWRTEAVVFSLVIVSVAGLAFNRYSTKRDGYTKEFLDVKSLWNRTYSTDAKVVRQMDDQDEFYRYSGNKMVSNANILEGVYNSQYYWSLSSDSVTKLYDDVLILAGQMYNLKGLDSRSAIETLCSGKYYVNTVNATIDNKAYMAPYGYTEKMIQKSASANYYIYENKYALPLGYTYASYLSEKEAAGLTPLERQEAMLQAVILADMPDSSFEPSLNSTKCECELICKSDKITMQGNSFVAAADNQSVKLNCSGLKNSETYLSIRNLQYQGKWTEELQVKLKVERKRGFKYAKSFTLMTPQNRWYNGRKDFLINLYYAKSPVKSVVITFPKKGVYTFDSIDVLCQKFENYEGWVSALKADVLEQVDLHENRLSATNGVSGSIRLDEPKFLVLTIPYSAGWTAYVDGETTELLKANSAFMAIPLDAGEHEIRLKYRTPGLLIGAWISLAGIVGSIVQFLLLRHRSNRKGKS